MGSLPPFLSFSFASAAGMRATCSNGAPCCGVAGSNVMIQNDKTCNFEMVFHFSVRVAGFCYLPGLSSFPHLAGAAFGPVLPGQRCVSVVRGCLF